MLEEGDAVSNGKGLARWVHAVLVQANRAQLIGGAGVEDAPVGRLHNVNRASVERVCKGEKVAKHVAREVVVRLDDGHVVAGGGINAGVARGPVSGIWLVDNAYARVARGVLLHDGQRTVGRAVVHADDLDVRERLHLDAGKALVEVALHVVGGDHHRHLVREAPAALGRPAFWFRGFHVTSLPPTATVRPRPYPIIQ